MLGQRSTPLQRPAQGRLELTFLSEAFLNVPGPVLSKYLTDSQVKDLLPRLGWHAGFPPLTRLREAQTKELFAMESQSHSWRSSTKASTSGSSFRSGSGNAVLRC